MGKYDVDYFIEKFKKIPLRMWCTKQFHNDEKTRFCARGHCGETTTLGHYPPEALELREILFLNGGVASINDGYTKRYPQKTPRSRVLAALRDVKKNGRGYYT